MPHPVAKTFLEAARLIAADAHREGNRLRFSGGEQVVYAGDIHGHRRNLAKIIAFADLAAEPNRRLVLQEIVHGGPTLQCADGARGEAAGPAGGDRSVEMLLRAARLKIAHPDKVFFLMGNHDVAEIAGQEVAKEGRGACRAFRAGLEAMFSGDADEVRAAVVEMFRSQPLIARCANGMLMSHSLPSPQRMGLVDWEVLHRPYLEADFTRGGSVYELTWGRGHTREQLDALADRLDARFFLLGHQHIESGYLLVGSRAIVVASNHPHGSVMVFDAGREVRDGELAGLVRPIVSLPEGPAR